MTRRQLEERLGEVQVPDEEGAEDRAWRVVRAAYSERTPATHRTPVRRIAVALAASLAVLAVALSPAGAEVVDVVRDMVGVDDSQTRPELDALPASGELLVDSGDGVWVVREDGSKRRLGDYEQATWSPRGLFVAAASGNELVALEPGGEVRWTVTAPGEVRDPRWSPSGFRIAYLSDGDLRVVAGDGTGDHVVARDVAGVPPAWRPVPDAKLAPAPAAPGTEQVSYVDGAGRPRLVDADTGAQVFAGPRGARVPPRYGPIEEIAWSASGDRFAALAREALVTDRAGPRGFFAYLPSGKASIEALEFAPSGERVAVLEREAGNRTLRLIDLTRDERSVGRTLFAGPGAIAGLTFSPDGRWLLAGWRDADQWLFIRVDKPRRLVAIDDVTVQFDPGDTGDGDFPRAGGWVLPER